MTDARLTELETACVDAGDSVVISRDELRELLRIARGRARLEQLDERDELRELVRIARGHRRLQQLDDRIKALAVNRDDSLVDMESL